MFDFSKVGLPSKINKEFVLERVSDSMIFTLYHGPFELGKVYPSRFRKDRKPSAGFYVSPKTGKLIYNDIGKQVKKDCFDFVQELYGLSFEDAVNRVAQDFGLVDNKPSIAIKKIIKNLKNFDKEAKKNTMIHFKPEKWGSDNLFFWKDFYITREELEREQIYAIKELWINGIPIKNPDNEPRYALTMYIDGDMRTKVYCPYSPSMKWITNIPNANPFGMESLTNKSPDCFLAKSQKCRIILLKFLPNVISLQSEQPSSISKEVDKELKFNYNNLYLGADNDERGLKFIEEMKPQGYIPMALPEGCPKDYSDLANLRGLGAVEKFLKEKKLI